MGGMMRAFLGSCLLAACPAIAVAQADTPPQVEESDVATLPALTPHWAFINTNWGDRGTRIIDGDSGKMLGLVHEADLSNFAADPLKRYYYIAETMWTKGNRGTRQDMVTVYDARTLKVVKEIKLPGRLLVGNRRHNLSISADGKTAYVYNMDPASTVISVDLVKGVAGKSAEVPGCGLSAAIGTSKALSLCADGSLALTDFAAGGKVARSDPFFNSENDPIFDNSPINTATGKAALVSFSGMVYPVSAADKPVVETPWSLQEAAGLAKVTEAPLVVSWLPGGSQPAALHYATGRLYVLMHMGEYWSRKEGGEELWVLDFASHKLLKRMKLEDPMTFVEVSQDAAPLLFLNNKGTLKVLDALTLEEKQTVKDVGAGPLISVGL